MTRWELESKFIPGGQGYTGWTGSTGRAGATGVTGTEYSTTVSEKTCGCNTNKNRAIGVFPKWKRNSLNSANSGNLINQ